MTQEEKQKYVRLVVSQARKEQIEIEVRLKELDIRIASFRRSADFETRDQLLERWCDVASKARYPVLLAENEAPYLHESTRALQAQKHLNAMSFSGAKAA